MLSDSSMSTINSQLPKSRFEFRSEEVERVQAAVRTALNLSAQEQETGDCDIVFGQAMLDYYSLCFPAELRNSRGVQRSLYCKCPRAAAPEVTSILPFTEADRGLAGYEVESLRLLERYWHSPHDAAQFVKIYLYVSEVNCLVLERVFGEEFYPVARRQDVRTKLGLRDDVSIAPILRATGAALARFHNEAPAGAEQSASLDSKVERYLSDLQNWGLASQAAQEVRMAWKNCSREMQNSSSVATLKGLDIRNLLVKAPDKGMLIDPGRIKTGEAESDLGRFLATLRLLYWGSPLLFLHCVPSAKLEGAFLDAYAEMRAYSASKLKLYFVKELTKHWWMAYSALQVKRYPALIRELLRKVYIDAFFKALILKELRRNV